MELVICIDHPCVLNNIATQISVRKVKEKDTLRNLGVDYSVVRALRPSVDMTRVGN